MGHSVYCKCSKYGMSECKNLKCIGWSTSNALYALVLSEQRCFQMLSEFISANSTIVHAKILSWVHVVLVNAIVNYSWITFICCRHIVVMLINSYFLYCLALSA